MDQTRARKLPGMDLPTLWEQKWLDIGCSGLRWFFLSDLLSLFGSQSLLFVLPIWVLQQTGNSKAMGAASLVSGISRISLMLLGGWLSDRVSPRTVLIWGQATRIGALVCMIALVLATRLQLIHLFGFAFILGIAEALVLPARGSLLPNLVRGEQLRSANAAMAVQEKVLGIVVPALAGSLIGIFTGPLYKAALANGPSLGILLMVSLCLAVFSGALILLKPVKLRRSAPVSLLARQPGLQASSHGLLSLVLRSGRLRALFGLVYGLTALSAGPLTVGLPVLVVSRFIAGPLELGWLSSTMAAGALLGSLLAGAFPPLGRGRMQVSALVLVTGFVVALWLAVELNLLVGVYLACLGISSVTGYSSVIGTSLIQSEIPPVYLGRMMSLLNFK